MSKTSSPKYYVFYEKRSGKILGAGNEKDSRFEYGIEVPFDEVENLLNGNWHFRDYLVGYKREIDGSSRLSVVLPVGNSASIKKSKRIMQIDY